MLNENAGEVRVEDAHRKQPEVVSDLASIGFDPKRWQGRQRDDIADAAPQHALALTILRLLKQRFGGNHWN
jgi:hypothetical protein